jgi:hypothetical protein
MADSENGYKVSPDRPPLHTRFKKGQSGNPDARSAKCLPVLFDLMKLVLARLSLALHANSSAPFPGLAMLAEAFH